MWPLFVKEKCSMFFFERSTLKGNLFCDCFVFPSFHEHSSSQERSPTACLLKSYCFEEITVWVIETMLAPLTFVHAHKGGKTTNQAQIKTNIGKSLKNFLNDLNQYFTTWQGIKIHIVMLESLVKTDTFWINEEVSTHTFVIFF